MLSFKQITILPCSLDALFGFPLLLPAQKEDYNWVFGGINITQYTSATNSWGENAIPTVFTFNTDPPSFYQDTSITLDLALTNAHYSDAAGNLLLYSNGMSIHGRDHKAIENGDTISFGPRWNDFTALNDIGYREPLGFNIHNGAVFSKIQALRRFIICIPILIVRYIQVLEER